MAHLPTARSVQAILLVQAFLGVLVIGIGYALYRYFLDPPWAVGAAGLTALSPHLVTMTVYVLSETWFTFLLVCGMWVFLVAQRRDRRTLYFVAGTVLGAASLTRPGLQYFAPLLALALWWQQRGQDREVMTRARLLLVGFVLVLMPWVVRRMFSDIDADIYVMADGDGTYDTSSAEEMVRLLVENDLDMVVGVRDREQGERYRVFRPGHRLGNALFTVAVAGLFVHRFTHVLSGYRCFSRRFVKSFPSLSNAFEIELKLTVHALELRLPAAEVRTRYRERSAGTESKLHTIYDGTRNLLMMIYLFKEIRPFRFFGAVAVIFVTLSVVLGVPVVTEFFQTGLVPRVPTAILGTGLMLLGAISLPSGLILDSFSRSRLEGKRLFYQTLSGPRQLLEQRKG